MFHHIFHALLSQNLSAFIDDDKCEDYPDSSLHYLSSAAVSHSHTTFIQNNYAPTSDAGDEPDTNLLNNAHLHVISPSPARSESVDPASLQLWEITVKV